MKTNKKTVLTSIFGVFLIGMGVLHFVNPTPFLAFIPEVLPQELLNILAGIAELGLGLGVFFNVTARLAKLGIVFLMLVFLPIHFFDMFRDPPAIGSFTAAVIRFPMQFVLIYWAWYIYKK
jgi:uncharacterized membrane protein